MSSFFPSAQPAAAPFAYSSWQPPAAAAAPAAEAQERVPVDPRDALLYALDRACGAGAAADAPDVARRCPPVRETAERPLTRIRELLRPYRKTERELLDRLATYEFRVRGARPRAVGGAAGPAPRRRAAGSGRRARAAASRARAAARRLTRPPLLPLPRARPSSTSVAAPSLCCATPR